MTPGAILARPDGTRPIVLGRIDSDVVLITAGRRSVHRDYAIAHWPVVGRVDKRALDVIRRRLARAGASNV